MRLAYDIEAYSSFMSTYAPRHILDDRPSDPGSRWSSATTNSPQFLLLVLPSLAIIRILCSAWHSSANPLPLSHARIHAYAHTRVYARRCIIDISFTYRRFQCRYLLAVIDVRWL